MVIHGWTIYFHACFETQLTEMLAHAQQAVQLRPNDYKKSRAFKHLAAVALLAFDKIPQDPSSPAYRQGDTLGKDRKHWFRAKFYQRYRLFFRYSETERAIIYAWVNDDDTLREYGAKTDAYVTFARMLSNGRPPDDWKKLRSAVIEENRAQILRGQMAAMQREREG